MAPQGAICLLRAWGWEPQRACRRELQALEDRRG